jgi:hypothetical protein
VKNYNSTPRSSHQALNPSTTDHQDELLTELEAAIEKGSAAQLLSHVERGLSTTKGLAEAMDVSPARISQLASRLIKEKKLTKRGRSYALPKAKKSRTRAAAGQKSTSQVPLFFVASDYRDYLDLGTLPRKAGCSPQDLPCVVFKEAADNACDAGRNISLGDWTDPKGNSGVYIKNDGPGLDPEPVLLIYSPNRGRFSSKHIRRISRGLLGNGGRVIGGAVAASGGTLMIESRGLRFWLEMDFATGQYFIRNKESIPLEPGVTLYIALGPALALLPHHSGLAQKTIRLSRYGHAYSGPSSPFWYGPYDLYRLAQEAQPEGLSFSTLSRSCGFVTSGIKLPFWDRPAKDLSVAEIETALGALRVRNKEIPAKSLGSLGPEAFSGMAYAKESGTTQLNGSRLPYVLEAWVSCTQPQQKGQGKVEIELIVNRSMTPTRLYGVSTSKKLTAHGCDLHHQLTNQPPKPGDYSATLSIITPYLPLTNDGNEPALTHLVDAILPVITKAARKAHADRQRPDKIQIKEAAWEIMSEAYRNASDKGELPANARQIMYAARPYILERTRLTTFSDHYFTQTLLPAYLEEHSEETESWDVVFDARGSGTEPHTRYKIPFTLIP